MSWKELVLIPTANLVISAENSPQMTRNFAFHAVFGEKDVRSKGTLKAYCQQSRETFGSKAQKPYIAIEFFEQE